MLLTMNGPIANLIALGVIATVTVFPSPEALKTTLDPRPELIASTEPRATPRPARQLISLLVPSEVPAPGTDTSFPSACANTSTWGVEDLGHCAVQLASYIEMSDQGPGKTRINAPRSDYNFAEEARASLAELCRSQWVAELSGTGSVSASCDILR